MDDLIATSTFQIGFKGEVSEQQLETEFLKILKQLDVCGSCSSEVLFTLI